MLELQSKNQKLAKENKELKEVETNLKVEIDKLKSMSLNTSKDDKQGKQHGHWIC